MAICAICVYCDREMTARTGCTVETYECPDGTQWARLPYRPEAYEEWSCHDCACPAGTYYYVGCDAQACPRLSLIHI